MTQGLTNNKPSHLTTTLVLFNVEKHVETLPVLFRAKSVIQMIKMTKLYSCCHVGWERVFRFAGTLIKVKTRSRSSALSQDNGNEPKTINTVYVK